MADKETLDPSSDTLKSAIEAARGFLLELHKRGFLGDAPVKDVVLEEIDRTPGGDWRITLGYRQPGPYEGNFTIAGLRPQRSDFYKTFTVTRAGEVRAMRRPSRDE